MERSASLNSEPVILSVETATLSGSVSLSRGAEPIAALAGEAGVSHSNTLLGDIDRILNDAGVGLPEVDLFAVASGPGSFTGLRIGIATVKSLASTLDRACAGIPTLAAVALAAGPSQQSVALLPAGRGEVFAQRFSVSGEGFVTALDQAAHISPQRLIERYGPLGDVVWCGAGALSNRDTIERQADGRIAPAVRNLAIYVARLALIRFHDGEVVRPDALQAIYVRPSDAELKA